MKRTVLLLTVCLLLAGCIPISAGSVPEDLLHGDSAQIFFAEVVAWTQVEGELVVELVPVVAVKGDVSLWCQLTYREVVPIGDFTFLKDKAYLFAYYDEHNPTYAFRASGYDPQTLSLLVPGEVRRNMFGRFEEYLNNGDYTAAEADRRERLQAQPPCLQIDGTLPPLDKGGNPWVVLAVGGVVVMLLAGGCMLGYARLCRKETTHQPCRK